ncbi:preprotein translocase subunit SecE [Bombella saccharophila]|uniref:Protein translocase subunit SecE n=1 Tax=Bombella saccharophila TaxID=2967338 RepID=A0ABT3WC67_9PROT|nr:preprotein translocase subunit SecE [Bombella saccharophila]MCX5615178.1 preprotein translocase subunit SecE [Bombella saccharophila]PHI94154.1 preprotein translocase subunit SecE [Parasaccharibacter apium]
MVSVTKPKGTSPKRPPAQKGQGFSLRRYFADVRAEAKRVTWPTRRNTIVTTGAVLAMVVATCIFFFVVDQVIGLGISKILGIGG